MHSFSNGGRGAEEEETEGLQYSASASATVSDPRLLPWTRGLGFRAICIAAQSIFGLLPYADMTSVGYVWGCCMSSVS